MNIPLKVVKSLRNHWKKSIFFSGLAVFGARYMRQKINDDETRRTYCENANRYNQEPIALHQKLRRATVFLNPAASEGSGRKLFEKNVAPLLYLFGLEINLVKTEYEGQAKEFMSALEVKDTDLIVVAGGDGLLAEVVSGIMKKNNRVFERAIPIAVIPVGKTNRFFHLLFGDCLDVVKGMCEAAMAVVHGVETKVDVMEIMSADGKQTFALSGLEFGSYRDATARKNKYWYFGPLKSRWTHVRTLMKSWPPATTAHIRYISADDAETARLNTPAPQHDTAQHDTARHGGGLPQRRAWSWRSIFFRPKLDTTPPELEEENDIVVGDEYLSDMDVSTVEFTVMSSNYSTHPGKAIAMGIGPSNPTRADYLKEGMKRVKDRSIRLGSETNEHLSVDRIKFIPDLSEGEESWYSIDGEQYEAKPINIQLLRNRLTFLRLPHPSSSFDPS